MGWKQKAATLMTDTMAKVLTDMRAHAERVYALNGSYWSDEAQAWKDMADRIEGMMREPVAYWRGEPLFAALQSKGQG